MSEARRDGPWALAAVTDKGSGAPAGRAGRIAPAAVVVDHHPVRGAEAGVALWNPSRDGRLRCAAAWQWRLLLAEAGAAPDAAADFHALVALAADRAIDPSTGDDGDSAVAPFVRAARAAFPALFRGRLLGEIAEAHFALSGGGFQWSPADGPRASAARLLEGIEAAAADAGALRRVGTLGAYLDLLGGSEAAAILDLYRRDLARAVEALAAARPVGRAAGATIRLSETEGLPALFPVAAGEALDRLAGAGEAVLLAALDATGGRVHVAFRATAGAPDAGAIATALAARLRAAAARPEAVSGGGHVRAAECRCEAAAGPPAAAVSGALRELLAEVAERAMIPPP